IQFGEEPDPDYRYATIDLFVDADLHGRGIGSAAITAVLRELSEARGHHRVTIDPAAGNARAIRLYERLGFRPVGVLHRSERDRSTGEWRDQLLMEWLADESRADADERFGLGRGQGPARP
ncbi:MAG: GNAT family N-acetyltransferase, partial [Solirubrobacteraceae bacterium]|nr:GNAT family N-acetyltransferase [Solirubrobacteraceae bacterium]